MRRNPLFPPPNSQTTGKRKRDKGRQPYTVLTVNGRVRLRRIRWHCSQEGASTLTDVLLDEAEATISQGTRELICRLNQSSASFRKTSANLKRAAQIDSNSETIRQVVEAEGKAVLKTTQRGTLAAGWTAEDCRTESGKTRVYVSCDGVKVPLVTDEEKKNRRQKIREKRHRCGGKCKPLARAKPGADNAGKEFRLVAHYDETQTHCHVSVTRGNHEAAGRLMARDALGVRLSDADEKIANVDGAPWIRNQLEFHGTVDHIGLDFYHFSEHIHTARRKVFGEDNAEGRDWADGLLHEAKHEGYLSVWKTALAWRSELPSRAAQEEADRLLGYISERRDMMRYPDFLAAGWPIGSGPLEAQCKTTTPRGQGP